MTITIDLSVEAGRWPSEDGLGLLCRHVVDAAQAELMLRVPARGSELSVLFTDDAHIRRLNAEWRGKDQATNVLSFPAFAPDKASPAPPLLGDIVLAAETVAGEAEAERKPLDHHVSHLVVHGFLHLVGYDHETNAEADEMEALERRILARLAIPDPYA